MAARKHYISDEQREAAEAEIVDRSRRIDFYTTEYTVELLAGDLPLRISSTRR